MIRASAGTGKTFQLSNRFLGLAAAGHPPDHILATTFARKAAGEILDRVLLRLAEAADDPKKLAALEAASCKLPRLDAAAMCPALLRVSIDRLHRLQISTLDSFFIQMASSFGLELGLPPGWRIVEAIEDEQIRDEAIQQVLHDHPLADSAQLVRLLGKGEAIAVDHRGDRRHRQGTVRGFPRNSGDARRLAEAAARKGTGRRRHCATLWPNWNRCRRSTGSCSITADGERFGKGGGRRLGRIHRQRIGLPACWPASKRIRGNKFPPEFAAAYQPLLDHARAVLINQLANQTEGTSRLLDHFDAAYQPLKLTHRALRFDDVTHLLAAALADGRLQDVGYRLDASVAHLLLDEFQDTSLAQWSVLRPFAKRVTMPEQRAVAVLRRRREASDLRLARRHVRSCSIRSAASCRDLAEAAADRQAIARRRW